MRIVILSVGSRGDVQPFAALGLGLRDAGHSVCFGTRSGFAELVERNGLDFAAVERPPRQPRQQKDKDALLGSGRNTIQYLYYQLKRMRGSIEQALIDSWRVCQGADAIICAPSVPGGPHIAEKLGVPCYSACAFPVTSTHAFPMVVTPPMLRLGSTYNRLTYLVVEQISWYALRGTINRWRRDSLGLPALPWRGTSPNPLLDPFGGPHARPLPWLYGFSPSVVPRPPDWPTWAHITGYWFLDHPAGWEPPPELCAFLRAGPPPVYVGFGSTGNTQATDAIIDLVLNALRRAGQRGVLMVRSCCQRQVHWPDDIFAIESIPFDWLFPQMAVVVHHGGAGTTAAGLRAGVPAVVVPFCADQPFWGDRVAALGVGTQPIMRKQLTVERLAQAISTATSDTAMQARAAALGKQIRAENGVARAVEVFHQYLPHGFP